MSISFIRSNQFVNLGQVRNNEFNWLPRNYFERKRDRIIKFKHVKFVTKRNQYHTPKFKHVKVIPKSEANFQQSENPLIQVITLGDIIYIYLGLT